MTEHIDNLKKGTTKKLHPPEPETIEELINQDFPSKSVLPGTNIPPNPNVLRPPMMFQLQGIVGNQAVINLVRRHNRSRLQKTQSPKQVPNKFHSSLLSIEDDVRSMDAEPAIMRAPAPSYFGGKKGAGKKLSKESEPGKEIAPGEKGFSDLANVENAAAAVKTLAYYKDAHLSPVNPDVSGVDKLIAKRTEQAQEASDKAKGKHSLWGKPGPYFQEMYNDQAADAQQHAQQLGNQKVQEQALASDFNSWSVRANQTFVSLAKLEALQETFGTENTEAMVEALEKGLEDAVKVVDKIDMTDIDIPDANHKVTTALDEAEGWREKMETSWLGYKATLVVKDAEALKKSGKDKEARLKEIKKIIDTFKSMGKTVDFSLTVMTGMKTLSAAGASVEVSDAGVASWSNNSGEVAKKFGKDVAGGVGIPTSAEGVMGGLAKLIYSDEIAKIEKTLAIINRQVNVNMGVAKELGIMGAVKDFQDNVGFFKKAMKKVSTAIHSRRLAYKKLGKQLDKAAKQDASLKRAGLAPKRGQERYASIMLLVAAIRETLAVGKHSKGDFKKPSAVKNELISMAMLRGRLIKRSNYGRFSMNDPAEILPLISIYKQTEAFHSNVDSLDNTLGPVEKKAQTLFKKLQEVGKSGDADLAGY